jgi:hypothetical protein
VALTDRITGLASLCESSTRRSNNPSARVLIDGEPPGDAHGLDVDEQGRGTVAQQRLYQLLRQPGTITDRTFEITFLAPGVEA